MKISIEKSRCEGHKRCFNLYPELFVEGADGNGCVREGAAQVSDDEEINAQSAANACPQGAIVIEY